MEKTWTADDAKLLRDLRVATGVDRATFARRCTISVGQLTELEDGGSGRFYSESIKSHTGRSLLAKLGHVRPAPQPSRMEAPPAPTPAPATKPQPAPRAAPAPAPSPAPEATAVSAPAPSVAALSGQGSAEAVSDVIARPVAEAVPAPARGRAWIGLLVVACAVIALLAWLNRPQAPAPAAPPAVAEPVTEVPALPAAEASAPASAASAPAVSASSSAPTATQATAAGEVRCGAVTGAPVTFAPAKGPKPANYVYLKASQPTPVCVTDAKQQQFQVLVKPGEGETVNGTPPFTVQAAGWAQLQVFFQGLRVPVDELGIGNGALLLQAP